MRATIHRHGRLLGTASLIAAIVAVVSPFATTLLMIPVVFGQVPKPPVNVTAIVLIVSAVLAIFALAAGTAVWVVGAPGRGLGMAAVLTVGITIVSIAIPLAGGFMMGMAHQQMRG